MTSFPFTAVVGADDLALSLVLTSIAPEVGGVLVRGEKGTAKSTMVRALVDVLPAQIAVQGCRFGCDPQAPDPTCPDGPHPAGAASQQRPARLVELPVGASEDRVVGSLDLGRALGDGVATFEPGLLAAAHRGILYVDEVNLLHDHLVDLLLDAAAMGRSSVERDGVSFSHAARFVLVGTMNPEEGELRPQLLDRFGLTVEIAASRLPRERAEVVRRRLAFDADPVAFAAGFARSQAELAERVAQARALLGSVCLDDWALETIARVCAGFEVDGLRADIVTARAARAHAAWWGRTTVTRDDIRAAARLALPHRRRRKPFDAPGLDEDLLEQLLGDDPGPDPEGGGDPDEGHPGDTGPDSGGPVEDDSRGDEAGEGGAGAPPKQTPPIAGRQPGASESSERAPGRPVDPDDRDAAGQGDVGGDTEGGNTPAPIGISTADEGYRAVTLRARGVGRGAPGRRSRAITTTGRSVGSTLPAPGRALRLHLPATIRAAAPRQVVRRATFAAASKLASAEKPEARRMRFSRNDLRVSVLEGPEANLVVFCVDASGSMGARSRMSAVKTAVLSLLMDAYQRRDRVAVVTFRGAGAEVSLPPTSSVEAAAACLEVLPHGGRTPLAEGLERTAALLRVEQVRDPQQRSLVLVLTDGRATAGSDALRRARVMAGHWSATTRAVETIVIDCETGRFRLGLAAELAAVMQARHLPLAGVDADALVATVQGTRQSRTTTQSKVA